MKSIFFKIIISFIIFFGLSYFLLFLFFPSSVVEIYRGEDEKTIWVKVKYLPIKKIISDTNKYKAPDVSWSPNKKLLAFGDLVRIETFNKEWALKIIHVRTFKIKTVFIGDYKTSEYKWIDNEIIRVYVSAGSGVRIYRDININTPKPFIAIDHMLPEYWTPEKTF